jgi:hypothetical protein
MTATTRREAFILTTITDLQREPGGWVALVDLRPRLDLRGLSRQAQDDTMKALSLAGQVHLVPEDNRKALVEADHAAALHLGGDDCHFIALA